MLRQHAAGKLLDLAEGHRPETARALEAQTESADAGKQIKHPQHLLIEPIEQGSGSDRVLADFRVRAGFHQSGF